MKKAAYVIIVNLIFVNTLSAFAQIEQTRQVSGFNAIASAGSFDVHVKINGKESLNISASAEIINEIETKVEDGILKIKFKHHNNWNQENYGKIDVYVTAKSLSSLTNAGSGSIKVEGALSGSEVKMVLSGSGNISSSVKSEKFQTIISGSGSIHVDGNASDASVQISGSGEMMGKELKTGSVSVSIAGSGSAYINAEKTISAHIIGSGNVIYSGKATVSDRKTIGSGRVSKAE